MRILYHRKAELQDSSVGLRPIRFCNMTAVPTNNPNIMICTMRPPMTMSSPSSTLLPVTVKPAALPCTRKEKPSPVTNVLVSRFGLIKEW